MDATEYSDDRAEPATTTGMMTLLRCPSGSQQQTQHRAEWIPSADRPLAGRPLATAKTGMMPARAETLTGASSGSTASNRADGPDACSRPHDHRHAGAETLTGASSGSTASNRADGPDACSRPHDHRHADGIIPKHPGASSGSTASNCADGPDACSIFVLVTALAFARLAALVTYSQAHSQRLAVVTNTVAYLACMQMYREGTDGVIDGLRWTFNKCAGGLVAAARWAFDTAVEHTQFVIIMLLLAYIAMSGAMGGTSATTRAAPIAHTLDQLTSGSARYKLALRLARGLIALALTYALTLATAYARRH